ncbi:MAG: class I SAM-dependent methyltransferase [Ignavibacteria bacterium]
MEKIFDMYARYYDLLYKDKNYTEEAEYIQKFIAKYNPSAKNILDLGCGTGKHDFLFAEMGYEVTGVELSEKMVKSANKILDQKKIYNLNLKFFQGDIRNTQLSEKFDVVVSLFHVMSYLNSNEDLINTLRTVKQHLKKDGIFLFDFWYGPAVLSQRPEDRVKKLEDDDLHIRRSATPVLHINQNTVDVNYRVSITEKVSNSTSEFKEKHSMRYLFIPEINFLLDKAGLELIVFEEWMTGKIPDENSWSVFAAVRNKN